MESSPIARGYFIRAAVRAAQGDANSAQADRQAGLATTPTDLQSWLARGMAWLPSDVDRAIADLQKALSLNPRSIPALRNLAHVYSESPRKDLDMAIGYLSTAIELRSEDAVFGPVVASCKRTTVSSHRRTTMQVER